MPHLQKFSAMMPREAVKASWPAPTRAPMHQNTASAYQTVATTRAMRATRSAVRSSCVAFPLIAALLTGAR